MANVNILFFASFKERLECDQIQLSISGETTIQNLCDTLSAKGGSWKALFSEPEKHVKIACNQEMVDVTRLINDGDEVAFFPPVTGG